MDAAPILIDLPAQLVGPRVVVRSWRAGDGPALFEAVEESREHLLPWLPWAATREPPEASEKLVREFSAKFLRREDLVMGIFDSDGCRVLGGTGLHRINWDVRSFEIGYWIRVSEQGKGYVEEACRLLVELAFNDLSASRVFIRCAEGNTRSVAIPPRLGFQMEGRQRNGIRDADGKLHDALVFSMIPEDRTPR